MTDILPPGTNVLIVPATGLRGLPSWVTTALGILVAAAGGGAVYLPAPYNGICAVIVAILGPVLGYQVPGK